MDAKQLAQRLARSAQEVAAMLLPNGVRQGHEWCVGSINGEKGQSLKICLDGAKAGVWADFGAGGAGDLIDLWMAVRRQTISEALQDIRDYLGIEAPKLTKHGGAAKRQNFDKPQHPRDAKPVAKQANPVETYLRTERGITTRCMKKYSIGISNAYDYEKDGQKKSMEGPWMLLPFLRPEKDGKLHLVNLKWWHVTRRTKPTDKWPQGKKMIVQARNGMPCLWGWQSRQPGDRYLLITEGEIDAMTWRDAIDDAGRGGFTVVSLPAGAGDGHKHDWIDLDWDMLQDYDTIYLSFDDDEEGQVALNDVSQRLGQHRCRLISLSGPKDANAALIPPEQAKWESYSAAQFMACLDEAKEMKPDTIRSALDFRDQVVELIHPTSRRTVGVPLGLDRQARLHFRDGELTLLTGPSGHGKSILLSQIKIETADRGEGVFEASMEMKGERTIERMMKQMTRHRRPDTAEIDRALEWLNERFWVYDVYGSTKIDPLLAAMLYARRRYNCTFHIIDSFMRCGVKIDDLEGQDELVKRLCAFAEAERVHVVLVAHGRKLEDDSRPMASFDIKGSGGMTDNAFNVLSVWRNKRKEKRLDEIAMLTGAEFDSNMAKWIDKPDAKLVIDKQRNGTGWVGTINLWYDRSCWLYRESQGGEATELLTYQRPPSPGEQPASAHRRGQEPPPAEPPLDMEPDLF